MRTSTRTAATLASLGLFAALAGTSSQARADEMGPTAEMPASLGARVEPDAAPGPAGPKTRFESHAAMKGRANPQMVEVNADATFHYVISRDERRLTEKAYFQAGGGATATSAYVGPNVHVEWSPAPLFTLRGEYQLYGFTGQSRSLLSFLNPDAPFGEAILENREAKSGWGHKLTLAPSFHARFGPVHIRNNPTVSYYRLLGANEYTYEIEHDTLVAKDDVVINSRTQVGFELWRGGRDASFEIGPVYTMTRAMRTEVQRQRIGGAFAFTPVDSIGPIGRPSIFAEVGGNAEDRNREGEAYASFGIRADFR